MPHKSMYDVQHEMLRKTVNLTRRDAEALAPFLDASSPERESLAGLVDEELDSESDVLRALVRLGIRIVFEDQLELGYAQLAASQDAEDEAWTRASMEWAGERWRDDP
jgi:hypothetical protein